MLAVEDEGVAVVKGALPKLLLNRLSKSSSAAVISHTHRRNQKQSLHAGITLAPFKKARRQNNKNRMSKQKHGREEGTDKS